MTNNIYQSFLFGENDKVKLEIRYDPLPVHPWCAMDMAGQLDQWSENAGLLPHEDDVVIGRGNRDAVGFTGPRAVKKWLDKLHKAGKWGVAFGIYCYNDCNSTMRLYENVNWRIADHGDFNGVIYIDSGAFQKWVGDAPNDKTDADRIDHAKRLLRGEFEMLENYVSGACFYGSLLRQCGHCHSWVSENSIGGYYGCDGNNDDVELARIILHNFDLTTEERESFDLKFTCVAV